MTICRSCDLYTIEIYELKQECEKQAARIAKLEAALRMTGMLKNLGGMLPGTHEIVQTVVNAASAALEKP